MELAEISVDDPTGQRAPRSPRSHRRLHVPAPVNDLREALPAEAVSFDVRGREVRVNLKLLSYCIPFLVGVGIMIGGMKTAGVPFIGVPQLIVGIVLTIGACWYFVSDSGRLDVGPAAPRSPKPGTLAFEGAGAGAVTTEPRTRSSRRYTPDFRAHAVSMVRSTGWPIARVARELDVNPTTLGGWVKKDREQRAKEHQLV